jgi:hypothetical protein
VQRKKCFVINSAGSLDGSVFANFQCPVRGVALTTLVIVTCHVKNRVVWLCSVRKSVKDPQSETPAANQHRTSATETSPTAPGHDTPGEPLRRETAHERGAEPQGAGPHQVGPDEGVELRAGAAPLVAERQPDADAAGLYHRLQVPRDDRLQLRHPAADCVHGGVGPRRRQRRQHLFRLREGNRQPQVRRQDPGRPHPVQGRGGVVGGAAVPGGLRGVHPAGGALPRQDGAPGARLLRRPLVELPLHGGHRLQVHRPRRRAHPDPVRAYLGAVRVHVANGARRVGHHLLRHPARPQHRGHPAQQQHARLRVRQEGGHRHAGHHHRTHRLARALRLPPLHALHHVHGGQPEVLQVVHAAAGHAPRGLQNREAIPLRRHPGRPQEDRQAQLVLRGVVRPGLQPRPVAALRHQKIDVRGPLSRFRLRQVVFHRVEGSGQAHVSLAAPFCSSSPLIIYFIVIYYDRY